MKKIFIILLLVGGWKWWYSNPTISAHSSNVEFEYVVKYPQGSEKNDLLPMLIALHGNGDTPENFYDTALDELTEPSRIILIKGPVSGARGSNWPWNLPSFDEFGGAFNEAVTGLTTKYQTKGKPILLGFSGGASMAYYQAIIYGHSYSSIFTVSGKLSKDLLGSHETSTQAKVYAYHGNKDNVISLSSGRSTEKLLNSKRVKINFTEFDGGHHGIFTNMKNSITQKIEKKLGAL